MKKYRWVIRSLEVCLLALMGLLFPSLTAWAKNVGVAAGEAQASKFTSEKHSFTGLKLKGEMKKPEFSYRPQKTGPRPEQLILLPENFDRQIFRVTAER